MTAQDIIIGALNELQVAAAGEPIDSEDLYLGLSFFNTFIDALKALRLGVFKTIRSTFTISANTESFNLGPGATWDTGTGTTRPEVIVRAGFVNTTSNPTEPLETPIHVYTDEEWAAIGLKTLTSTIGWLRS